MAEVETQVFVADCRRMLGTANATSGMILRWKPQIACAVVWMAGRRRLRALAG